MVRDHNGQQLAPVYLEGEPRAISSGKLLTPLGGHVAAVRSVAFTADGKGILTGGEDGRLIRWDPAGKELGDIALRTVGTYPGPGRYPMGSVLLTADGKSAVWQLSNNAVFDVATGLQIAAPASGFGFETRVHLCPDARTLLVAPAVPFPPKPQPKSLKITAWDVLTGAKLCEIETPVGDVVAYLRAQEKAGQVKLTTQGSMAQPKAGSPAGKGS